MPQIVKNIPTRIAGAIFLVLLVFANSSPVSATGKMVRLATPGPWPGVTQIIGFDGKIWISNGDPYTNENAADIYTYDPGSTRVRYERGLYSQDVGRPAVFRGALYWPFEDPRSSLGLGEYAQTDGENWRLGIFPSGVSLHVHAMETCRGSLMASTGGWVGGLQTLLDDDSDWREIYRMPPDEDRLSRITDIRALGERCFFSITSWNTPGPKLAEWVDGEVVSVPDWPDGARVVSPVAHNGKIIAINQMRNQTSLWSYNGTTSQQIGVPDEQTLRALASNGSNLYLLTGQLATGALWRQSGGGDWEQIQTFEGERPISIAIVDGDIYVGTYKSGGAGSLWGPKTPTSQKTGVDAVPFGPPRVEEISQAIIDSTTGALEAAISPRSDYLGYRQSILSVMLPLARTRSPLYGEFLAQFIHRKFPEGGPNVFTNHRYSFTQIAYWITFNMMAINGHGRVPSLLVSIPRLQRQEPNGKYFLARMAAIRAVGWIGQKDHATLSALIDNLRHPDQPVWLKGDSIASLTALTGKRFGHDYAKWLSWWAEEGINDYPPSTQN